LGFSTLSVDDVLCIHKRIREEARVQGEPVAEMNFPGEASFLKNRDLLESAVARQWAGFDGRFFYPTPHHNASTLMYGIAMNHPFHDGNKRTFFGGNAESSRSEQFGPRWYGLEGCREFGSGSCEGKAT